MNRGVRAIRVSDGKLDREAASRAAKQAKADLRDSAKAVCTAFAGAGTADQRVERMEALMWACEGLYVTLRGPDAAHPFLASLAKDTGFRIAVAKTGKRDNAHAQFDRLTRPANDGEGA